MRPIASTHRVLQLQRMIGNQGTLGLLDSLAHVIQQDGAQKLVHRCTLQRAPAPTPLTAVRVRRRTTPPPVFWGYDFDINSLADSPVVLPRRGVTIDDVALHLYGDAAKATDLADYNGIDRLGGLDPRRALRRIKGLRVTDAAYERFETANKNKKLIPVVGGYCKESPEAFLRQKKYLDAQFGADLLQIMVMIDLGRYNESTEQKTIDILTKWATETFTTNPKRYPNGGDYLDQIFEKLKGRYRDVGGHLTTQRLSHYSILLQEFDRAEEIAVLRDLYSYRYKADSGVAKVTYGAVFVETAFERALSIAGVPRKEIMDFLNRAGDAFSKILKHPGRFLSNLIGAVRLGFRKFRKRFPTYFKEEILSWIFGRVSGGSVDVPADLSPRSILKLVLQILEITPAQIVSKVEAKIGSRNVHRLRQAKALLSTLMQSGIGGLWALLKEQFADLKASIRDAIQDWLLVEIVEKAIFKIVKMFNPVSGLVSIIEGIYDIIKFFIEKASAIKALFERIGSSLTDIVNGKIESAAARVEEVLKNLLRLAIEFLSGFLNIRIAEGVREAIEKIRGRIKQAIDGVVAKIAGGFRKTVAIGKAAASRLVQWWKIRVPIRSSGVEHTLQFRGTGEHAALVIKSKGTPWDVFLEKRTTLTSKQEAAKTKAVAYGVDIDRAKVQLAKLDEQLAKLDERGDDPTKHQEIKEIKKQRIKLQSDVVKLMKLMSAQVAKVLSGLTYGPVGYGESALSQLAQRLRLKLGPRRGRGGNVAVFEFKSIPARFDEIVKRHGGGDRDYVIIDGNRMAVQNVSGADHSEELAHKLIVLGRKAGLELNVRRIYTEYSPCTRTCLPLIRRQYPNADVSYSFRWDWRNQTPDRNAAVDALFGASSSQ